MKGSIAKVALIDAGFWIALLDCRNRDGYHYSAVDLFGRIEDWHAIIPWPVLYEVVSTRLVKNNQKLLQLSSALRMPGIELIDDAPYRELALGKALNSMHHICNLSLVDCVLREMIADVNLRIDGLATFNYRDFEDVCRRRRVPIFPRDVDV